MVQMMLGVRGGSAATCHWLSRTRCARSTARRANGAQTARASQQPIARARARTHSLYNTNYFTWNGRTSSKNFMVDERVPELPVAEPSARKKTKSKTPSSTWLANIQQLNNKPMQCETTQLPKQNKINPFINQNQKLIQSQSNSKV